MDEERKGVGFILAESFWLDNPCLDLSISLVEQTKKKKRKTTSNNLLQSSYLHGKIRQCHEDRVR